MTLAKNRKLLVVDDDDDIRETLTDLLTTEGYEVSQAKQGLDALAQLRKGLWPSLILLDLMMPKMNGWEFLEAQRADPSIADLPVVILSADRSPLSRAVDAQVRARLAKPFDISQLLAVIERCAI
jgi:two-component system, chemotaxis family, chemotaxis protein CheY